MQVIFKRLATWWNRDRFLYSAIIGAFVAGIMVGGGYVWFLDDSGYVTNLYTELIIFVATIFVLNRFTSHREEFIKEQTHFEELERIKNELLADVRYGTNVDAVRAVNRMRLYDDKYGYGWFRGENSLLANADLLHAQLASADLSGANLSKSVLNVGSLEGANLSDANFEGAHLAKVNLKNAWLYGTNFEGANFHVANLEGVRVGPTEQNTNFKGASLEYANLNSFELEFALYDEKTTLPDRSKWSSHTDIARFINPKHDKFWDPCKELKGRIKPHPEYCADDEQ